MDAVKRQQDEVQEMEFQPNKKPKLPKCEVKDGKECNSLTYDQIKTESTDFQQEDNKFVRIKRKKVALLLTYSGWGYYGMQRNPDTKTIEGDLLLAMKNAGVITDEHYEKPQKMLFQRAARTDKGVSAVRQVVCLKLPEDTDVKAINEHLPPQIRVVCMKRTTNGFNSKTKCDARTYSYVLPTFAFSPSDVEPSDSFRISKEIMERINKVLKNYVGTHNFHNFTFKRGFDNPSAKRYMHSFICGEPFVRSNREYITLTVKGQSFMQHHIRKMIGLAIAVLRGYTSEETIQRAFTSDALDLPKAPGLGLMLEEVHYEAYNKRFGNDGIHEPLDWSKYEQFISDFKEKYILQNILKTEEEEKSMLTWMATLPGHSYSLREERPSTINGKGDTSTEDKASVSHGVPPVGDGAVHQDTHSELSSSTSTETDVDSKNENGAFP